MRKVINVLLLGFCFVSLISCSSIDGKTKPLSNSQLDEFIKSKQLNVQATEEIAKRFTVIMYENEATMGFYTAYVRDGKIESGNTTFKNNAESNLVSVGGVTTGNPFAIIKINDQNLVQKAEKVRVIWDDGKETVKSAQNQNALIIPNGDSSSNIEKSVQVIDFLDAKGNIIFQINE
ncbi:hypothetical protein AM500_03130 [Bacillus sp. FJAT-18017]|uniref:hypothetical protein n=1 Tax=Bacillus sp. FJAT-18017 TaxID=1705566 RepID=UPI0006ADDF11|nr:hypothetical protein [Bacillus sp. FJAT-18017]ALC88904.1 hypothetical protein AM500_03130 [Bacillus sp. FJAT-18017]